VPVVDWPYPFVELTEDGPFPSDVEEHALVDRDGVRLVADDEEAVLIGDGEHELRLHADIDLSVFQVNQIERALRRLSRTPLNTVDVLLGQLHRVSAHHVDVAFQFAGGRTMSCARQPRIKHFPLLRVEIKELHKISIVNSLNLLLLEHINLSCLDQPPRHHHQLIALPVRVGIQARAVLRPFLLHVRMRREFLCFDVEDESIVVQLLQLLFFGTFISALAVKDGRFEVGVQAAYDYDPATILHTRKILEIIGHFKAYTFRRFAYIHLKVFLQLM